MVIGSYNGDINMSEKSKSSSSSSDDTTDVSDNEDDDEVTPLQTTTTSSSQQSQLNALSPQVSTPLREVLFYRLTCCDLCSFLLIQQLATNYL